MQPTPFAEAFLRQAAPALHRADGRTHNPGDEACEYEAGLQSRGHATALLVDAALKPDMPRFKTQSGFARQGAVTLRLPAPAGPLLAVYQHKDWWLRPAFVEDAAAIPARTQLLLWKQDGEYCVLLAPCGPDYRGDMSGGEDGLVLALSPGLEGLVRCQTPAAVLATGPDAYACCEEAAALALACTGNPVQMRGQKQFPPMLERLGWCSWDAFYHSLNEAGLLDKMAELREKNLPVGWVMIDDGWSDADYERQELRGLGAAAEKFPGGLAGAVTRLKEEYGVGQVGVWHALMGYWNGIARGSEAEKELLPYTTLLPDGRRAPSPHQSFGFWNTWHGRLARQGVDFVKMDEQSAGCLFYGGRESYGAAARGLLGGMRASAGLHFGGNAIHCMGMAPQELWSTSGAALLRSSDDFVPDDANGFAEHCLQNAYNALLYGPLYWGDWDMFWSSHETAWQHSMLRAVSGGPVYTSDKVGETDAAPLLPLILADGRLLRCEQAGRPTQDCLLENPLASGKPLKIFNRHNGAALVAAFHLNEGDAPVQGELRLADVGLDGPAVVYNWQAGQAGLLRPGEALPITLAKNEAAIYLLVPQGEDGFTPLGLLEKYLSTATIRGAWPTQGGHAVALCQGGMFGFWAKTPPAAVAVNGKPVQAGQLAPNLYAVNCAEEAAPLVTIRF